MNWKQIYESIEPLIEHTVVSISAWALFGGIWAAMQYIQRELPEFKDFAQVVIWIDEIAMAFVFGIFAGSMVTFCALVALRKVVTPFWALVNEWRTGKHNAPSTEARSSVAEGVE